MASILVDPAFGVDVPELGAKPATPATGRRRLYAKTGGWYDVDDADAELKLTTDDHNHETNGVRTKHSTADVTNPPSDAELDAEFGTPAVVGAGFLAGIDDNGGDANFYLVYSTGASWVIFTGAKAT